jgi:hypothetical protein
MCLPRAPVWTVPPLRSETVGRRIGTGGTSQRSGKRRSWVYARPSVTAAIPGARTTRPARLRTGRERALRRRAGGARRRKVRVLRPELSAASGCGGRAGARTPRVAARRSPRADNGASAGTDGQRARPSPRRSGPRTSAHTTRLRRRRDPAGDDATANPRGYCRTSRQRRVREQSQSPPGTDLKQLSPPKRVAAAATTVRGFKTRFMPRPGIRG